MKIALGTIPIAVAKVVGRNHEADHAAIDETQVPVIVFVNLEQRNHVVGILLTYLFIIRLSNQVKALVGISF